jgi:hypothetical protein
LPLQQKHFALTDKTYQAAGIISRSARIIVKTTYNFENLNPKAELPPESVEDIFMTASS